jgi:hypothetical protein
MAVSALDRAPGSVGPVGADGAGGELGAVRPARVGGGRARGGAAHAVVRRLGGGRPADHAIPRPATAADAGDRHRPRGDHRDLPGPVDHRDRRARPGRRQLHPAGRATGGRHRQRWPGGRRGGGRHLDAWRHQLLHHRRERHGGDAAPAAGSAPGRGFRGGPPGSARDSAGSAGNDRCDRIPADRAVRGRADQRDAPGRDPDHPLPERLPGVPGGRDPAAARPGPGGGRARRRGRRGAPGVLRVDA